MSAADRSRASTSVRDQMDLLAKTVLRSTDPVRPLLHLITRLDQGDVSTEDVRSMALDSILLSMHGASVLETRRKKLLFGDNKVVGALFDRKVEKPLLSTEEVLALDALYEHEKHKKKMRTVLGAPRTFGSDKPSSRPSTSQQSGVNFGAAPSRGRGQPSFRRSDKTPRDSGRGRGCGSGEARGERHASAQDK